MSAADLIMMFRDRRPHPVDAMEEPPDDETLASRSRAGDAAAFDRLTARHIDRVYRLALLRLGSRHDAEDLTQDVFLAAYHAIASFRGEARFSTWLTRIALNRIADHMRGRSRRPPPGPLTGAAEVPDLADGPPRAVSLSEELARTRAAIEALPEVFRRAFVLRVGGGLSYKEIAEVLDCAPGTVDSRIARARALLAQKLGRT